MSRFRSVGLALLLVGVAGTLPARVESVAALADTLHHVSLDPEGTYKVRDLELVRGDIKIYLNDGVVSFLTPIAGRYIGAFFTTEGVEAGDAEIILLPPQRSERASLASYAKTPNIDEHFGSALFLFTDETAHELLEAIERGGVRKAPEQAAALGERVNPIVREVAAQLEIPLVEALLDNHQAADGIFYAMIGGRALGGFDVTYDPTDPEPISVGRISEKNNRRFQLWTNFRPRKAKPYVPPEPRIQQYWIDASIAPDLSMSVSARFRMTASGGDGRVLALDLSPRLKVQAATIDGTPAEILQRPSERLAEFGSSETFLVVAEKPLAATGQHEVRLQYLGSTIRRTPSGEYFVDDRSSWYPTEGPEQANFDLTFHCAAGLHLVSTGELVEDKVDGAVRTIHRVTDLPVALAGFNLGDYSVRTEQHGRYLLEIDSPNVANAAALEDPDLAAKAEKILDEYGKRWMPLPRHSLSISPIAGSFGQGFPGLIYLSSVSYIKEENRAAALRNARSDAFFSELLLPHELAHQWWGNIVRQADYRSAWITEAMANDAALEHIERTNGAAARDEILESYRRDLEKRPDGQQTVESAGPVDFGQRLIDTHGLSTWHVILYEKGSWILRMLRERLGDEGYRRMQNRLLDEFGGRPLSNEGLRQVASSFVPKQQPDPTLRDFFDTWVYGNGIPALELRRNGKSMEIELSGVDDDFVADLPLRCKGTPAQWVRLVSGSNRVDLPHGAASCELPSKKEYLYVSP